MDKQSKYPEFETEEWFKLNKELSEAYRKKFETMKEDSEKVVEKIQNHFYNDKLLWTQNQ